MPETIAEQDKHAWDEAASSVVLTASGRAVRGRCVLDAASVVLLTAGDDVEIYDGDSANGTRRWSFSGAGDFANTTQTWPKGLRFERGVFVVVPTDGRISLAFRQLQD